MYKTSDYLSFILKKIWVYLKFSFLILGTVYTGYTIWIAVFPDLSYFKLQELLTFNSQIPKWKAVLFIIIGSMVIKLLLEIRYRFFNIYHLANSDLTISIRCGNLLKTFFGKDRDDGTILIGVNDCLQIGSHDEDKNTLMYQVQNQYEGVIDKLNEKAKNSIISQQNIGNVCEESEDKDNKRDYNEKPKNIMSISSDKASSGYIQTLKFDIGKYFQIRGAHKQNFIFLVMSTIDKEADGPITSISYLNKAYETLFMNRNLSCKNEKLYIPLVGKNCGMGATHSSKDLLLAAARNYIQSSTISASVRHLVIIIRPATFLSLPIEEIYSTFKSIEEICPKCKEIV